MQAKSLPVSEFTSCNPVTAREDMTTDELRELMARHDIRHLPVVRGDAVVGIVSERDVRLVSGLTQAEKLQVRASDIMATEPLVVEGTAPLEEVADKMSEQKIGSVIVNDEGGRFVGIFTATDALSALVELVRSGGTRWTHPG